MSELKESHALKDVQKTLQPSFPTVLPRPLFTYYADLLSRTKTDIANLRKVGRNQEADVLENSRRNSLAKRIEEIDKGVTSENISASVNVPLSKTDVEVMKEVAQEKIFTLEEKGLAMGHGMALEDAFSKAQASARPNTPGPIQRFIGKFRANRNGA